ncbi:hypothetical protein PSPO01_11312 [Paraphaeosphaeria sporulosa]
MAMCAPEHAMAAEGLERRRTQGGCVLCCSLCLQVEVQRGWSTATGPPRPGRLMGAQRFELLEWRRRQSVFLVRRCIVERFKSSRWQEVGGCGDSHRVARMQLVCRPGQDVPGCSM